MPGMRMTIQTNRLPAAWHIPYLILPLSGKVTALLVCFPETAWIPTLISYNEVIKVPLTKNKCKTHYSNIASNFKSLYLRKQLGTRNFQDQSVVGYPNSES